MIIFIIFIVILILFSARETFYFSPNINRLSVLASGLQEASLNTDLTTSVESYREKLIFIYCSGCKSANSRITTELFNSLGNKLENINVVKLDVSRNSDPIDIIRGFIHPKYLIKDSFNTNEPTTTPNPDEEVDYQYNINNKLRSYFHPHNDVRSSEHVCEGPQMHTNPNENLTTIVNRDTAVSYEQSDEYTQYECDYFLVYKTPTILFEIHDHAFLKFPEEFPIQQYPCELGDKETYQQEITKYIKKLQYWIYYLKNFKNQLIGLYQLIRIDLNTSCRDNMVQKLTDTVTQKDAIYNIIGKYYDILCNAYPKTDDHINRLDKYIEEGTHFYRNLDTNSIMYNSNDSTDLDYLKVNRTRVPSLRNKLLLTDPENVTIRGYRNRLINYAQRTLIIYFNNSTVSNFQSDFVDNYRSTPELFIRNIRHFVLSFSNQNAKTAVLQRIFNEKGFPTPSQTWRSFVDPTTGMNNENYGFYLITFDQIITDLMVPPHIDSNGIFNVCLETNDDQSLCFQNFPIVAFNNQFDLRSENRSVRQFQNIIQPCLFEFGFIKSDRLDNRIYGCENIETPIEDAILDDTEPCSGNNCRNEDLTI